MLDNNSYKSAPLSNFEHNSNSVLPSLQAQSFFSSDRQEDNRNFTKLLSLLQRRSLVIAGVSMVVMATLVAHSILNAKPSVYESSFRLLVEPVNEDSNSVDVVKDSTSISNLDYETQIQVLKSPELIGNVVKRLQSYDSNITYDFLLSSLIVKQLGGAKIIEVRYSSEYPKLTKLVLDEIAKEYLEYSQERRQTRLRQGIQFVERQLPSLQTRVDQIQKELQFLRQNYNLKDPDSLAIEIGSQAADLSKQRQELNLQLAQVRASLAILQGQDGEAIALSDAQLYQQLIGQVRQLDVQIAKILIILQEDNPIVLTLKEQRDSLLPLVRQEAQNHINLKLSELTTQLQRLEVINQQLSKNEQTVEQRRKQLPNLSRKYTDLQRSLQVATESLNRFLSTRENLQIQISQTELGWQLIESPSLPQYPANSTNTILAILQGLGSSLLLGLGAALLLEKLDNTYHDIQVLKEDLKLLLLGNIPFEVKLQNNQSRTFKERFFGIKQENRILQENTKADTELNLEYNYYSSPFLEAFRVLYTNIKLLNSDHPIRSLVISSATQGDGKSTVAFNLARIATAMGQRVLLVDADLRQPTIHKLSKLNNSCGLSNLISSNLPISEVILQAPSIKQLSVITTGSLPPDPTKLLSSEKMKHVMRELAEKFDLVIYDVPPLAGLADASLIAPHTNGVLIVVKIDQTNSSVLKLAIDDLKIAPVNILGIVGNAQKIRHSNYY
ncbi:GumC family protein [Anabaena subtropica]|uniref:non-specific protein-tyrosine kinase n=1 Tax=Anabaena subtropica FACHB-260 TaxID=2692884 RepID=A0ABR8CK96_9NOST|nr:polysaccharide biosynthesis tyrosine autokinase [Anabaena subtropica]MBD2343404.1 polysaccharide biosynthesis tyrosine autokinase [Anabaena subtropica FACHB-260]